MKEKYDKDIAVFEERIKKLEIEQEIRQKAQQNLSKTMERISDILQQKEPTPELYRSIVAQIVLFKNHDLDIHFKYIDQPVKLHYETSGKKDSYHVECQLRPEPESVAI